MICYLGREGRAESGWYVVYGFLSAEGKNIIILFCALQSG